MPFAQKYVHSDSIFGRKAFFAVSASPLCPSSQTVLGPYQGIKMRREREEFASFRSSRLERAARRLADAEEAAKRELGIKGGMAGRAKGKGTLQKEEKLAVSHSIPKGGKPGYIAASNLILFYIGKSRRSCVRILPLFPLSVRDPHLSSTASSAKELQKSPAQQQQPGCKKVTLLQQRGRGIRETSPGECQEGGTFQG